jgi:glycosyltransferase involved in cell wall biosynthesis
MRAAPSLDGHCATRTGPSYSLPGQSSNRNTQRGPFCIPIRGPVCVPFDIPATSLQPARKRSSLPYGLRAKPTAQSGQRRAGSGTLARFTCEMNFLFVHQNFPGQYRYLAGKLAADRDNRVVAITKREEKILERVERVLYKPPSETPSLGTHPYLRPFELAVRYGEAAGAAALRLKRSGFTPDVICTHPGWGEALFMKDIYPEVPLLNLCEFYFQTAGGVLDSSLQRPAPLDQVFTQHNRDALFLLALESMDWGVSPIYWQRSRFPAEFHSKISVIHDGIDTRLCAPDPDARLSLPNGRSLTRDDEVVTYVARNLEPMRGFPTFMRAVALLVERRPNCHIVVVGGDEVSYGAALPNGETYRQRIVTELGIECDRIHFLGKLPYGTFLRVLRVSRAHVYLTLPFVLSWSFLEAMSSGCLVLGSNTPPVAEVIRHGDNGLLVDFLDHRALFERLDEALEQPERFVEMRDRARRTVVDRYSVDKCLPLQIELVRSLARGRLPAPGGRGESDAVPLALRGVMDFAQ